MAYDRYEQRRGWRERDPRARFSDDDRFAERSYSRSSYERDRDERGFFERAGDEIASWFGDDDAERRRATDERRDDGRGRRATYMSDDDDRFDRGSYERSPRYREEGYRRPYTGRFGGRSGFGDRFSTDRGPAQRDFGAASGVHDPHYAEWRSRQIDALDRDYDDYRRENQARFESEFSNWRGERQSKRQLLGTIREHMEVVGSDDEHVGKVDRVAGDRIILAKNDEDAYGAHHSLSCSALDRVEGDRVMLNCTAEQAKAQWRDDRTDRALFEREDQGQSGPHILNRSFSGTY